MTPPDKMFRDKRIDFFSYFVLDPSTTSNKYFSVEKTVHFLNVNAIS